jgi:hypothetical protein
VKVKGNPNRYNVGPVAKLQVVVWREFPAASRTPRYAFLVSVAVNLVSAGVKGLGMRGS